MKKLVVLSVFLLIAVMSIGDCKAKTIKEEITSVRMTLGKAFNETVNLLKDQIRPQDELIKSEETEIKDLYDTAKYIKDRVVAGEVNPTVLEHGREFIQNCGASQEMYWNGSKWKCRGITAGISCDPTTGEDINPDGICVQPGTYNAEIQGWEDCNNNKGERYTATGCMFENSKDGSKIQVTDSDCTNFQIYEQACGVNGAKSTCKCPADTEYYHGPDKNGKIIEACKTAPVNYISKPYSFSARFCTDHFAKLRMIVGVQNDKTYVHLILEAQNPGGNTDGRCGFRHLSKGQLIKWGFTPGGTIEYSGDYKTGSTWVARSAFNANATGAFYYLGKIELFDHPEKIDLDKFVYTFRSSGSGCSNVSGTGAGNTSFGGVASTPVAYDRVYDGYSVTFCPANSAQSVNVYINVTGIYGYEKEVTYEPLPVCKQRDTISNATR
jgi:hypothetical protein